jgi:hypothetical protein
MHLYFGPVEKVSSPNIYFFIIVLFGIAPKRNQKSLVRLNLSARIRLNFRLARKALKSPIKPSRKPPARKTDRPARLLNSESALVTKEVIS